MVLVSELLDLITRIHWIYGTLNLTNIKIQKLKFFRKTAPDNQGFKFHAQPQTGAYSCNLFRLRDRCLGRVTLEGFQPICLNYNPSLYLTYNPPQTLVLNCKVDDNDFKKGSVNFSYQYGTGDWVQLQGTILIHVHI